MVFTTVTGSQLRLCQTVSGVGVSGNLVSSQPTPLELKETDGAGQLRQPGEGEAEAGESGPQGYLWLSSQYEASLDKKTGPLQAKNENQTNPNPEAKQEGRLWKNNPKYKAENDANVGVAEMCLLGNRSAVLS